MKYTASIMTVQKACEKHHLVLQVVLPGHGAEKSPADVLAKAANDGAYEMTGLTLAGRLLLSVLVKGGDA